MSATSAFTWPLLLVTLAACAGTHGSSQAGQQMDQAERAKLAARLAPDLYARAQEAKASASRASGDAREDLEQAAELWIEAAYEEADRITLERKRREHEARSERAQLARAEVDRTRLTIEAETRREQAARLARAEAVKMLAMAAGDEQARDRNQEPAHAEVAAWLASRAELTLAAARALGLAEADAAAAEAALLRARKAKKERRLEDAQAALAAAERAVGDARALRPAATGDERDALLEMATERSLSATRDPRGVVLELRAAFTPGTAKLTGAGRAQLAHLLAIARAHPHGPIHIEATRARGDALLAAIGNTPERARFNVVVQELPDRERVFAVLVGYGEPAVQ